MRIQRVARLSTSVASCSARRPSSAWREYEKTAAPGRAVKVYVEHYLDAVSNGKGILTFARQANRLVFVEAESLRYY